MSENKELRPLPVIGGPMHGMMASHNGEIMRAFTHNATAIAIHSEKAASEIPIELDYTEYRRIPLYYDLGSLSLDGMAWVTSNLRQGDEKKVLSLALGIIFANLIASEVS